MVNKIRKLILGLVFLLGLAGASEAQTSLTGRITVGLAADRPVACITGDVYEDTDDSATWRCFPNSTWISFGGGLNSPITVPNPLAFDVDVQFKISPWRDVSRYGKFATASNTTATTVNGSANVALAAASNFQNGEFVTIFNAGAATGLSTPSAPTVTPSLNAGGLNSTAALAGASSFSYEIVAATRFGGYTPASTAGSTSTGNTLGVQTINITSMARSARTVTVLTASAHPFVSGSMVYINYINSGGTNLDSTFNGFFIVKTAPDNTHFTFDQGYDTAGGATTSDTGGKVTGFNVNHITWTPVANAFKYYIYGRSGGTFNLLGVTMAGQAFFDDFGSPMNDSKSFPDFIPTTAPSVGANDHLTAKINSGGGTTSLVLNTTAGISISGATARSDDGPALVAACVSFGLPCYVPASGITVNSFSNVPSNVRVLMAGSITTNDTVQFNGGEIVEGWDGGSSAAFAWEGNAPSFIGSKAYPQVNLLNGPHVFRKTTINCTAGNGCLNLTDQNATGLVTNVTMDNGVMTTGNGNTTDYLGMHAIFQNGGFGFRFDKMTFLTGSPGANAAASVGLSPIPTVVFKNKDGNASFPTGNFGVTRSWFVARSSFDQDYASNSSGINWILFKDIQTQNSFTPVLQMTGPITGSFVNHIDVEDIAPADFPTAIFANLTGNVGFSLWLKQVTCLSGNASTTTGNLVQNAIIYDACGYGANRDYSSGPFFPNQNVTVNNTGGLGYAISTPGAPTVAISGASGPAANTYTYKVMANDAQGNYSLMGPASAPITVNGSQGVLVTFPAAVAGQVTTTVCRAAGGGFVCAAFPNGVQVGSNVVGTTFLDNGSFFPSQSTPSVSTGFQAGLGSAGISTNALIFTGGGFKSTITGSFTANRTLTLTDTSGTIGILSGAFTNSHCLQANVVGGNIFSIIDSGATCGGGGGGATFQVNGVNTTSQTTINFQSAATFNGLTLSVTNPSAGNVLPVFSGTLNNSGLTNSSVTVNTTAPLAGGGTISLGGSLNLTCTTCGFGGVNPRTTNYTLVSTDNGVLVTFNNSNLTATLPATPPSTSWDTVIQNLNSTTLTISRNGLLINGVASNIVVPQFQSVVVFTDGTNYFVPEVPLLAGTNITITSTSIGSTVAATGTGVGGSGTTGFIPKWSSSANLTNSAIDDGITTIATVTSTEPIVAPSVSTTGLCNGGTAGCINMTAGTAPTSFPAGTFTLYAPASITTPYGFVVPAAPATGIIHATNTVGAVALSISAINLASAEVTGNLPFAQLSAGTNSNAGTFAVSSNTWDFSAAALFKARVSSGLTTTVNGDFGYDTTNKNWHVFQNGVDSYTLGGPVSGTYVNNDCVKLGVTAGVITLVDSGAACSSTGATFQTNTVNNSSQTTLNLLNSAATNGITLTVTNTSAGNVQLGVTGTLNNAGLTNSSVSFNGVSVALGASGNISLDQIINPAASKIFTFLATNTLTLSGTSPASQSGAGINAGTLFSVTAVTGSATTGSATTAGTGSQISLVAGDGGSGSGGTNAIGGIGGAFIFNAGGGGASSGSAANANGGGFTFTSGSPGTGGGGAAGTRGIFLITIPSLTTAVTNSTIIQLQGSYQNSGTPTFAADTWSEQVTIGAGTNGITTLAFSHSGSSGAATVLVPNLTDAGLTAGNCVQAGAGGILTTIAGACAAGGSGTVNNSATAGAVAYYIASGTAVDGNANYRLNSSGIPITIDGLTTAGLGVPITIGVSNVTAQSTSQGAVTIATAPAAGSYMIRYYAAQNAVCTTGTNNVSFTFNWTDAGAARTLVTGPLTLGTAQVSSGYLSGLFPFFVNSGNVTYTSTVNGTCASGTSSYDIHASIERTQ